MKATLTALPLEALVKAAQATGVTVAGVGLDEVVRNLGRQLREGMLEDLDISPILDQAYGQLRQRFTEDAGNMFRRVSRYALPAVGMYMMGNMFGNNRRDGFNPWPMLMGAGGLAAGHYAPQIWQRGIRPYLEHMPQPMQQGLQGLRNYLAVNQRNQATTPQTTAAAQQPTAPAAQQPTAPAAE